MTQGALPDGHDAVEDRGPPLEPGILIAKRYRLTRLLGAGTSGTVYEAEHTLLTSRVAIKFLDGVEASQPERAEIMLERFRFEAQVSARLAPITKHIVAAQDAGLHEGIPYLVMELAPGDSLESKFAAGPLTAEETVEMLTQIGEALDAAHSAGIAHRDVKPANLLYVERKSGEPPLYKLADFGVAKLIGTGLTGISPPKATAENTLVGSPAYMSPEYVSGATVVDGRLDIWALAVVAYEALTLSIPFDGEVWTQVAVSIVQGAYKPVTEHNQNLPVALDAFFARAFSQNAEARYTTASELATAFSVAVRGDAVDAAAPVVAARRASFASLPGVPPTRGSLPSASRGLMNVDEPTDGPVLVEGTEPPKKRSGLVPILIGLTAALLLAFVGVLILGETSAPAAPTGTVTLAAPETASPKTTELPPTRDTATSSTAAPTASAEVAVVESATPTASAKATAAPVRIRMKRHLSKSEIP